MPIRPVFELPPKIPSATLYDMYYIATGGYMTPVPGFSAAPTGGAMMKQSDGSVAWQAVPSGFGGQFGDGFTTMGTAGLEIDLRATYAGSIYRVTLDANAAASASVDVKLNGTSIYAAVPGEKPTLESELGDDRTLTTPVPFVLGDRFTVVLDAVSGGPKRLTLMIFARRNG